MKKRFFLVFIPLFFIICFGGVAGDKGSGWTTDYKKALEKAKAEKRWVLMDFTGSDWCPPCMALKKDIFDQKEFKDYAEKNLVLLEVDFPGPLIRQTTELKEQNKKLKEEYKAEELPAIIILDSEGKEIWRNTGYIEGGPPSLISKLQELKRKTLAEKVPLE